MTGAELLAHVVPAPTTAIVEATDALLLALGPEARDAAQISR